jgi:hypothetical protein
MSVIVETPILPEETVLSFEEKYSADLLAQEEESTVYSVPAMNEKTRFSKKNYTDGYRCVIKPNKKSSHANNRKPEKPPVLEYFTTKNVIGHPIRNARTGFLYSQYRVGQVNECLFFKIRLCTEESNEAQVFSLKQALQKSNIPTYDKPDPDVLFYDSPEEYENHFQITLSQETKDQWRTRYERLLRYTEKTKRAQTQSNDSHIKLLSSTNNSSIAPSPPGLSTSEPTEPVIKKRPPSPNCPPPGYETNVSDDQK